MARRIEPKKHDVPAHARTLLTALRGVEKREITIADAAALSGLPQDLCEAALIHLGSRFDVRIRTTSAGALLFTFDSLTRERSARQDRLARIRARLRDAVERALAVIAYVVVPNLTLMASGHVYALLLFVWDLHWLAVIPLAPPTFVVALLLFCAGFLGFFFTQLLPAMALSFFLAGVFLPVFILVRALAYEGLFMLWLEVILLPLSVTFALAGFRTLRDLSSGARELLSEDSLTVLRDALREVSLFLLGPRSPDADGLEDERRVVAFLRAHRGVLTTTDLMVLFGTTRADADREATRVLADYAGEIVITEDGALVYTFDALLPTSGAEGALVDTRPAWAREAAPRFFGCDPRGAAAALLSMLLALLGLALHPRLVLFPNGAYYASMESAHPVMALEGVGAIPYLVPLAVLLVRLPFYVLARVRHTRRARVLDLLARAYGAKGELEVPEVATPLLVALGGEVVPEATRADGHLHLRFPALRDELRGAETVRARHTPAGMGDVVFDTHEGRA